MNILYLNDFGELTGVTEFPPVVMENFRGWQFVYEEITGQKRDDAILLALVRVFHDQEASSISDPDRKEIWEQAWNRNLENYIATGKIEALIPDYLTRYTTLRFKGNYIKADKTFELNFYTTVCRMLFHKYFRDASSIIEFGCGPGYAIALMAEMFPGKSLYCMDWAKISGEIIQVLKSNLKRNNIHCGEFDMFRPGGWPLPKGTAVFTALAMEQLGGNWKPFLKYLLELRPSICVHLEPLCELYDGNNLFDWLAMKYHEKRGYLRGFLPALGQMAKEGVAEIIETRRLHFGGLYHEPYSVLVWRPL